MDADLDKIVRGIQAPLLGDIVALAKRRGIDNPRYFWELFDLVWKAWRADKSCEGSGWI